MASHWLTLWLWLAVVGVESAMMPAPSPLSSVIFSDEAGLALAVDRLWPLCHRLGFGAAGELASPQNAQRQDSQTATELIAVAPTSSWRRRALRGSR